jgi:hypothetical protein
MMISSPLLACHAASLRRLLRLLPLLAAVPGSALAALPDITVPVRFDEQASLRAITSQGPFARMEVVADDELSDITGQLFFADKIVSSGTVHGIANNFTFYRLGLEADLRFNLNIDKLQLGCGGFNEGVALNACDLDVDFMRFAGFSGPGSDFLLEFPYLEIAVKNDGDRTRREVAGIKIGAATAEGILGIGRRYSSGQRNQEWGRINGLDCTTNTSSTQDDGRRLACSSGANRMSGFLIGEMSANGRITDYGGADVCMGWTVANTSDRCGIGQRMFLAFSGTRMDRIGVYARGEELRLENCGFTLSLLGCPDANFKLSQSLRMLHEVKLTSTDPSPGFAGPRITRDFFLSFQRERIAYPIYNQSQPYATTGPPPRASLYNHTWESQTSAWSAPANTGWWMNITYSDLRDLSAGELQLGGLSDALAALGAGGTLQDLNLGQVPLKNCFGTAVFC